MILQIATLNDECFPVDFIKHEKIPYCPEFDIHVEGATISLRKVILMRTISLRCVSVSDRYSASGLRK